MSKSHPELRWHFAAVVLPRYGKDIDGVARFRGYLIIAEGGIHNVENTIAVPLEHCAAWEGGGKIMRTILLLGLAIFLAGVLWVNYGNIRNGNESCTGCGTLQVVDEVLLHSLLRYEGWVGQYEDTRWVYVKQLGYPMYLYSFGIMYARLYALTRNPYHLREFLRIVDGVEQIRNDDWTWSFFDGAGFSTHKDAKSSLYNAMFSELFITAWLLTQDNRYKEWAGSTVRMLEHTLPSHRVYNYYFLPFTAIAYYCYIFGCTDDLISLGKRLYNHALSGYDSETGYWYYSPAAKAREFYDGHSAFFQIGQIGWFLDKVPAIRVIFPVEYQEFADFLNTTPMVRTALEHMLPSGTFFLSENIPNYTESAGNALYAFALLADFLGGSNEIEAAAKAARETILAQQAPEGGFYKSPKEPTLELWFGDNIANNVARYLYWRANLEDPTAEGHGGLE